MATSTLASGLCVGDVLLGKRIAILAPSRRVSKGGSRYGYIIPITFQDGTTMKIDEEAAVLVERYEIAEEIHEVPHTQEDQTE